MIGIIGGNGVAATNKLLQLVEEKFTSLGAYRDGHHPEIIAWQATKVPSRSMFLEGRGKSFIDDYIRIGRHLKDCGCDKLCMCCNTAHYYIDQLETSVGGEFINIIEEVAKRIQYYGGRKIGVMCSDGLRKVGMYEKTILAVSPNSEIIYPTEELQALVTKGICNSKNIKRNLPITDEENPAHCFAIVCDWFEKQGCDIIVAGCTDIRNVYLRADTAHIKYIDSLEVLADVIVDDSDKEW